MTTHLSGSPIIQDGGEDAVRKELLASRICRCFDVPQILYEEEFYDGQLVTKSKIITSKQQSIISKMAFDIYAVNHDLDTLAVCTSLDPIAYYGMNILDYLIGNTDRHPENWGFLIDNENNRYLSLYPLMDFNLAFTSYDTLDGALCQTTLPRRISQREAAIEAVKEIGLMQKSEIDLSIFDAFKQEKEMFLRRLNELKKYAKN